MILRGRLHSWRGAGGVEGVDERSVPPLRFAFVSPFDAMDPRAAYSVVRGDAVAVLRSLADESVDLVVTDPPYESLEKHRARGTTTRLKHSKASSNDWFSIFPNARFEELLAEVYRVLRRDRHFYLWCDQETMFVAKPIAERVGFKFWKPLVHDKCVIGMGYHYRARYELVLFFEKGKRKLADLGVPDIIAAKRIRGGYPTEKPIEVARVLVSQSARPGELVVDPFAGSGVVGAAALEHGCDFLGGDTSDEAVALSARRLSNLGRESAWISAPYVIATHPEEP